ncbi:hypothetical protein PR048_013805 [Dryococelus australis]|uniref:C2H2-type domain-containing protein n=1 Tax=Dryococelus australis TaxID=614101 RepID=A0ABQ9HUT0_9NEOP|nr:hypothetical protein PR048_013805 [Dryococelus australis]
MKLGDVPRTAEDVPPSPEQKETLVDLNHSLQIHTKPNFSNIAALKRPSQDYYLEAEHIQFKKRRKQSKPVKIEALENVPTDHDSGEENISNDDNTFGVPNEEHLDHDVGYESHQCSCCSEIFTSESSFQKHFKTNHILEIEEGRNEKENVHQDQPQIPLNLSSIYRLKSPMETDLLDKVYNQWNSEVKKACEDFLEDANESVKHSPVDYTESLNDGKVVLPRYLPLAAPLILPSLSTEIPEQKPVPCHMSLPVRVFNPEAFCQLCNKEFCNKYFLKTHKANKHGIYVENPHPPLSNLVPMQATPIVTASFEQTQQPAATNNSHDIFIKSLPTSHSNEEHVASQLLGSSSAKEFCDICKKKFCNRYFVRRHKAKIHGIVDDLYTSTTSSILNLPEYAHKQDCEVKGNSSTCCIIKPNIFEQDISTSFENKDADTEICRSDGDKSSDNLYDDKITISQPEDIKECEKLNSKVEYYLEKEVRKYSENYENIHSIASSDKTPSNPSPDTLKDASYSVEKLKQLGVINADAFCEICCKEYCNKYFLRTHKMKRHGIVFTDGEWQGRDDKTSENGSGSCIHAQTSPLNLIMGDHGNNSSDSGERVHSDSDDIECDICRRKFQSHYLMHMHRAYLHAVAVEEKASGNNERTEECIAERKNNEISVSTKELLAKNVMNINDEKCEKYDSNDDIQKLKTMIMQLNDLSMSKVTVCTVCNQEMQTTDNLKSHMMTEHGIFFEEKTGILVETHTALKSVFSHSSCGSDKKCSLCKKEFVSDVVLKQHIEEFHGYTSPQISSSNMHIDQEVIKIEMDFSEKGQYHSGASTSSDKRTTLAPTNSYCEICNKELCNKYFMKTHMQRMHGIEIENGAQIGGVICDVCNKELCSKYFLRVHKQNTHGIIEEGAIPQQNRESSMVTGAPSSHPENDNALKPLELGDLSHRYFSHFTEVCPLCSRRFRSTKWLKAHLFNDHGESGAEKWKDIENTNNLTGSQTKKIQVTKNLTQQNHSVPISNHSLTLKIPNNWGIQDQNGTCLRAHGQSSSESVTELDSQKVLTNLLGPSNSSLKSYHCSYCSFSTTILAFLFVHEKSHTGLSSNVLPHTPNSFQCPVCLQCFDHIDVYQHHIVTHQFSGLLNPFFSPSHSYPYPQTLGCIESVEKIFHHSPERTTPEQKRDKTKKCDLTDTRDNLSVVSSGRCKFRCSKCFQRFRSRELCAAHVANKHGSVCESVSTAPISNATRIMVAPQKHFKCSQCNFSSIHSVILKKHIRKAHKSEMSLPEFKAGETETWVEAKDVLQDVKKKLEDAVKVSKIPASYAVPQSQPPYVEGFLMQPFLLEEPDQKFVPSLVFLPVKEKMSEPVTVSFMLTPA